MRYTGRFGATFSVDTHRFPSSCHAVPLHYQGNGHVIRSLNREIAHLSLKSESRSNQLIHSDKIEWASMTCVAIVFRIYNDCLLFTVDKFRVVISPCAGHHLQHIVRKSPLIYVVSHLYQTVCIDVCSLLLPSSVISELLSYMSSLRVLRQKGAHTAPRAVYDGRSLFAFSGLNTWLWRAFIDLPVW